MLETLTSEYPSTIDKYSKIIQIGKGACGNVKNINL